MFPFQFVSSGGERSLAWQDREGDKWCHLWQLFLPLFSTRSGQWGQQRELCIWDQAANPLSLFLPWTWVGWSLGGKLLLVQALALLWTRRFVDFLACAKANNWIIAHPAFSAFFLPLYSIFCTFLNWPSFFRCLGWWAGITVWLQVPPITRIVLFSLVPMEWACVSTLSEDVSAYPKMLCQHQSYLTEMYLSQSVLQGLWKCLVEESGASTEERLVLHWHQRVTKVKGHRKHCSWELFLEWSNCHLGKRGNFLMTCLLSSAFIYNIVCSSYFCFGVAKWQQWKHIYFSAVQKQTLKAKHSQDKVIKALHSSLQRWAWLNGAFKWCLVFFI